VVKIDTEAEKMRRLASLRGECFLCSDECEKPYYKFKKFIIGSSLMNDRVCCVMATALPNITCYNNVSLIYLKSSVSIASN
jgi:hypothetical protein